MINVSKAISSFNTVTVTVTRTTTENSIVDYEMVKGETTTSETIKASVQQTSLKELQFLPTGYLVGSYLTVYTTYDLRMDSEINNITADVITYNNRDYKVIGISNRQDSGYTKAYIALSES